MFKVGPSVDPVQVAVKNKKAGLCPDLPCVMHIYNFPGMAKLRDQIVAAICNIDQRREWDANIVTLE